MYFPDKSRKRKSNAILAFAVALALLASLAGDLGVLPSAHAAETPVATATTASSTTSKTKVAYGKTAYPSVTSPSINTYRKLNYVEGTDGNATYFYDFDTYFNLGCDYLTGSYAMTLYENVPGFYGLTGRTTGNGFAYTVYSDLDNVTVWGVQIRSFDGVNRIKLDATPGVEHTADTTKLVNGPYKLCVWFDYVKADKSVVDVSDYQTVYVSDGKVLFPSVRYAKSDAEMKTWLANAPEYVTAENYFQGWMASHGGNDMTAALRLDHVGYPFFSGTARYPNDTAKWRKLAHDLVPDETVGDYVKVYNLVKWMGDNLRYDSANAPADKEYRWATSTNTASYSFTTWNTHLGMCEDFSNIFAIMCRELGVPCRIISGHGHSWNAVHVGNAWYSVDLNKTCTSAIVGASRTDIETYWKAHPATDSEPMPVLMTADFIYSDIDGYASAKDYIDGFEALDFALSTKAYLAHLGGIYNH